MKLKDEILTQFLTSHTGIESSGKLDPSNMLHPIPDFGFNNFLEFAENEEQGGVFGWKKFMDSVSM